MDLLEALWAELLSEQSARVITVFRSLKADERLAVYAHLKNMATEAGWMPVQRDSALAALAAIRAAALAPAED